MISIWHILPDSWKPGSACTLVKYVQEKGEEMPDLALCKNETCPAKKHCFRFTAEGTIYAAFTVRPKADRCEYYIPAKIEEGNNV